MCKTVKVILVIVLVSLNSFVGCSADTKEPKETQWLESYAKAVESAKKQKRPILANFSGSDWCGWCIKLKQEVFDKSEFKEFAAKEMILLELDFPRNKPQTDEIKGQNKALSQKYGIRGFPTILLIDHEGNVLGRTGYVAGGPKNYIDHLRQLLKPSQSKKKEL